MHTLNLLLLLPAALSLLSATAAAATRTHTVTLQQWPLGAAAPTPLGTVAYDPATGEGEFVVAAAAAVRHEAGSGEEEGEEDGEVRVGVLEGEKWFGGVVKGKTLRNPEGAEVTVRVDGEGRAWHVQYRGGDGSSSTPTVHIVTQAQGPQPALNKPVVLTVDGKIPVPEVEKTFLQKYWWVLLGATLLIMTSGGAE